MIRIDDAALESVRSRTTWELTLEDICRVFPDAAMLMLLTFGTRDDSRQVCVDRLRDVVHSQAVGEDVV